jgi:hypothetical protein
MTLKLNLDELLRKKLLACIHTTIGELCIFSIFSGGQIALHKELGKPLKECEPTDFVRHFVQYICLLKSSLKDGVRPSKILLLSSEDASLLTDDDLEKIAEIYIINNEDLFKKNSIKDQKINDEKISSCAELTEIEYPRHENENFKQYLLRLCINEEEKTKKAWEKTLHSLSGIGNFSKELSEGIKNTLAFGDNIKESFVPIIPRFSETALTSNRELSCRLDKLIDLSNQSKNFLIEANTIQTGMAAEIKTSGDEAVKISKKDVKLTRLVIVLTGISLLIVFFSLWQSTIDSKTQRIATQKSVDSIVRELVNINKNIIGTKEDRNIKIERKLDITNSKENENNLLELRISELEKMIFEMRRVIEHQKKELEKLEKR